jgi:acyl-CoA synthetase (NDP forming)
MTVPFESIFHPRSVAVVGVPRGPKTGRMFLQGLLDPGFKGAVYGVNPEAESILGVRCYPTASAIPGGVELAIVVVPTGAAVEVVRDLGRAGTKAAVIFTAGFAELGTEEGRARERELLAAAAAAGVRLIGPNCMGVYCPAVGLAMSPGMPAEGGPVAFVSQSGSLCMQVVRALAERGLGCTKAVSVGNQADLGIADFLDYLTDDTETGIIALYVEGVKDGRRFRAALRRAAARKPVVVWKAGRTRAGARAAASHTGSLAGSGAVWAALIRQCGAVQAREVDELLDTVTALAMLRAGRNGLPGRRVAIITGPGGPAVSAADACEEAGLELAVLSEATIASLRPAIAAAGTSPRNPVDVGMVFQGATEVFGRAAALAGADPGVDALVVIGGSRDDREGFGAMLTRLRRDLGKPVMQVALMPGGEGPSARALAEGGVGLFPTAERALRAYRCARDDAQRRADATG